MYQENMKCISGEKMSYDIPEMEIIHFESGEDIITESGNPGQEGGWGNFGGDP